MNADSRSEVGIVIISNRIVVMRLVLNLMSVLKIGDVIERSMIREANWRGKPRSPFASHSLASRPTSQESWTWQTYHAVGETGKDE